MNILSHTVAILAIAAVLATAMFLISDAILLTWSAPPPLSKFVGV